MCANVHATRHCNDEGYDLLSIIMVSLILMEEVDEIILEVKCAPEPKTTQVVMTRRLSLRGQNQTLPRLVKDP